MSGKKIHKIVFIAPIYLPAHLFGSEMIVRDLAETLAKFHYDVTVVTSDAVTGRRWYIPFFEKPFRKRKSVIHGVRVLRLPCRPVRSLTLFILNKIFQTLIPGRGILKGLIDRIEILSWGPVLAGLESTLVRENPDITVLSPFPAGICLSGAEICADHHLSYAVIPFFKKDQRLFENMLLRTILDRASTVFTPTETEKKYIQQFTINKNISILPSSIDISYIQRHKAAIERQTILLKQKREFMDKRIVLFAGIKGRGKGVIDAAEAVKLLHNQGVVLAAIGSPMHEWNDYLSVRGNTAHVVDKPYATGIKKYAYFNACDVLILPSTTDNFPLVFLEAWQFGKPVLTYDFYSMKELVGDGSGFLAKQGDVGDLSNKLARILSRPQEAVRAGKIGQRKVHKYIRDRIVRQYFIKGYTISKPGE